ncbi:MAG: hypothetical protein FWD30_03025 [Dehalococcoidia bacterium]|nr:hypothetical protein [Dehalococcoidia bacterium]
MKTKTLAKRIAPLILSAMMLVSMFASTPLAVSADEGSIHVADNPTGATYVQNAAATKLTAAFMYERNTGDIKGTPDGASLRVQWYWSDDNSNTSRDHGLGENTATWSNNSPSAPIETTYTPATNTVGVRYYYAVLKYVEVINGSSGLQEFSVEVVSQPARIEVSASDGHTSDCTKCCCWACCIWSWIALVLLALLALIGWIAFFAKKGDRGDRQEMQERRGETAARRDTSQRY